MADTHIICVSGTGIERRQSLGALITPALAEQARADTNAWIKSLRRVPYGGLTMRNRFRYRDDSLWWFTELYLQKMRQLDGAVLTVLALEHAQADDAPARLIIEGADATTAAAALAFGAAHGVPTDIRGGAGAPPRMFWSGAQVGVTAALSRARQITARALGAGRTQPAPSAIAAFVHTAFWRGATDPDGGQESYIGPVLDALARTAPDAVSLVGIGPRQNFTSRRWWDAMATDHDAPAIRPIESLAPWAALQGSMALWRTRHALADAIVAGEGIRDAAAFRGCDLWPVLSRELRGVAQVQWPWSARAMDEAGAALDALECHTAITYAEAGGWGRAVVLEARRRGVRSVGLQHGFIYRHWLNYLHEPDEMLANGDDAGFPAPDQTLLFDHYAEQHLRSAGAFPATRLAVTGSPRLDDLVARIARLTDADRQATREAVGVVEAGQHLVVLTAKFTEVQEMLPALIDAVRARPGICLAIKAHPAENADVYTPYIDGLANVALAPADADLARLLAAADALVTRNSTVAVDGLVLGLPALVIGLPNNLSPFVDAGVMLGAGDQTVGNALERLLYDRETRTRLKTAAREFVEQYGLRARGTAAEETAAIILTMGPH
mgnify:CR=1 FL=1